jgi:hypothetical protein
MIRRLDMRGTRFGGAVIALILTLTLSSPAFAEDRKPDATLELTMGSAAIVLGYTWGSGTLTFQDKKHPVVVDGFSLLALGLSQATATGEVFNLAKLEDFNGTFMAASIEGTFGAGAGATTMRNQNGVVINLFTTTQGLNVKVTPEGVRLNIK